MNKWQNYISVKEPQDRAEARHFSGVFLMNREGKLILQHRDNKPNLSDPDMLAPWGGAVEEGESYVEAAIREAREETGLELSESDLEPIGEYHGTYPSGQPTIARLYVARGIDEAVIHVYEGQGYVLVDLAMHNDSMKYSDLTRQALESGVFAKES